MTMDRKLNFIKKYRMDESACDAVIKFFNENKLGHTPGYVGEEGKVNKKKKDSTDLSCWKEDFEHMGDYGERLYDMVADYINTEVTFNNATGVGTLSLKRAFNIQHYKPGGGYPKVHCESVCHQDATRALVWMTYLTDTPNAGTAFPQWDYVSECEKGLTLIWPAYFTHMHHGIVSEEHEKMIITGWIDWVPDNRKDGS
jgi:prolyl 4-hydroxylase